MDHSAVHIFRKFIKFSRKFWPQIIGIFFLNLLSIPLALLKPFPLKIVIDSGFGSAPLPWILSNIWIEEAVSDFNRAIISAILLVVFIAIMTNLQGLLNWLLQTYTGEKLVLKFRSRLFDHLQHTSLKYHDRKGTSDSLYRIQYDAHAIRDIVINGLSPFITSGFTILGMLYIMAIFNWHFAMIAILTIPGIALLTRYSSKRLLTYWSKVKEDESSAMSVIHETLSSLRVVKAFTMEEFEREKFVQKSEVAIKGHMKVAWIGGLFDISLGVITAGATALFLYLGALYVQNNSITLGELTILMTYLAQLFGPVQTISKHINGLQGALVSLRRSLVILDQDAEVEENPKPIPVQRALGSVKFDRVRFAYSEDQNVLDNLTFEVTAGKSIGILGSTGSGKSTLINLLTRFYDPSTGTIYMDGRNIRDYRLKDYRNQFGIVLQEPVLFSTSLAENIAYGNPSASMDEIIDAAKNANAHDFIIRIPGGYEGQVGERGLQLSGGERQRVSLARAFLKNAPILILDEPTSSVDVGTESLIMEAINRLMKDRTTFMITHRIDTLKQCDILLHLEQGKLVELTYNDHPRVLEEKKNILKKFSA
jgi:ATP-binding cassette subfamily B protein